MYVIFDVNPLFVLSGNIKQRTWKIFMWKVMGILQMLFFQIMFCSISCSNVYVIILKELHIIFVGLLLIWYNLFWFDMIWTYFDFDVIANR